MTKPIVSATNLAAGYGSKMVWHGANFTINKGDFVGLIGPNGAGKTTLFKQLLGLTRPTGGGLKVFGEEPARGNDNIGYMPQRRIVDDEVNVEAMEYIKLGLLSAKNFKSQIFGFPKGFDAKVNNAIKAVDGASIVDRPVQQLSGGELQRIFLAQALIGDPGLLLLDEPLANLDIRRETEIITLVKNIVEEREIAALLIAHDINPLLKAVNKIIYIAQGHVVAGTKEEVINSATLSKLYEAPVEVIKDSRGRIAVLGTEEVHHDH